MIPEFVDNVLPEGVHECTLEDLADRFGGYGRTGQRFRLVQQLQTFVEAAKTTGMVTALVIDGSFVTAKSDPNDIDIIVVLRRGTDLTQPLRPFEYNVLTKPGIRRTYGRPSTSSLPKTEVTATPETSISCRASASTTRTSRRRARGKAS